MYIFSLKESSNRPSPPQATCLLRYFGFHLGWINIVKACLVGTVITPHPNQLKASLAEQLSVEQLRDEFRRYIRTKVAQELVDFYLDSLDREEVAGFFERQVHTISIVGDDVKSSLILHVPRAIYAHTVL